jgi:7-carboxy-7-deazaguanine synthase
MPERFTGMKAAHFFLSPMASPTQSTEQGDPVKQSNTRKATDYCLANPRWRLTLQMHKIIGID